MPRNRPHAFHVFMYAPLEEKLEPVREAGKSEAEAMELVSTIDVEHATFIKRYFGNEWPSRQLYHLMINSRAGDEIVIRTILDEIEFLSSKNEHSGTPNHV